MSINKAIKTKDGEILLYPIEAENNILKTKANKINGKVGWFVRIGCENFPKQGLYDLSLTKNEVMKKVIQSKPIAKCGYIRSKRNK